MSDHTTPNKRRRFMPENPAEASVDHLRKLVQEQETYLDELEKKASSGTEDAKASLRVKALLQALASKEEETRDVLNEIRTNTQTLTSGDLKTVQLDPAVLALFKAKAKAIDAANEQIKTLQSQMGGSNMDQGLTGKQLVAKSRGLKKENEELTKQLNGGKVSRLRSQLAIVKQYNEELAQCSAELNEFVIQLDTEAETMQNTVVELKAELASIQNGEVAPMDDEGAESTTTQHQNTGVEFHTEEPQQVMEIAPESVDPVKQPSGHESLSENPNGSGDEETTDAAGTLNEQSTADTAAINLEITPREGELDTQDDKEDPGESD